MKKSFYSTFGTSQDGAELAATLAKLLDVEHQSDRTIQDHWSNSSLPHFSGIILGNGMMVAMGEQNFFVDGKIQQHVYPICETSIDSFLGFDNEFVEVAFDDRRVPVPGTNCFAIGGEGEMGNEGFVAVVNCAGLVWAGFFTGSNPFHQVHVADDCIVARTTHGTTWRFPLSAPWKVRIANEG
ncbi:MAG TPA: hypothetical protein VF800_09060 [Telluria sp.]